MHIFLCCDSSKVVEEWDNTFTGCTSQCSAMTVDKIVIGSVQDVGLSCYGPVPFCCTLCYPHSLINQWKGWVQNVHEHVWKWDQTIQMHSEKKLKMRKKTPKLLEWTKWRGKRNKNLRESDSKQLLKTAKEHEREKEGTSRNIHHVNHTVIACVLLPSLRGGRNCAEHSTEVCLKKYIKTLAHALHTKTYGFYPTSLCYPLPLP